MHAQGWRFYHLTVVLNAEEAGDFLLNARCMHDNKEKDERWGKFCMWEMLLGAVSV